MVFELYLISFFDFVFSIVFNFIFDSNSRLPRSVYVQADDWGLIHVAEMNLSVRISWSNWWQLACWSVDDFITDYAPPHFGNRPMASAPSPLMGIISAGAAISNQGPNRGSAKILLAPSTNGGSRHNKPLPTISNHLVPFLLSN